MMKFAVKNPLKRRISGARTNRTESEKKACQPGRASTGLDCEWGSRPDGHRNRLPSAKEKECPLAQGGRSCTGGAGLSGTRLCRWPDSCNGRTPRTRRNETTRRRKTSCCGRALPCRPCRAGFNPQQHRLPGPASFSNTHASEYSEGARREARARGMGADSQQLGLAPTQWAALVNVPVGTADLGSHLVR